MGRKKDELLEALAVVGEALARVDRPRLVALIEAGRMVAAAHGEDLSVLAAMRAGATVDLDQSTAN